MSNQVEIVLDPGHGGSDRANRGPTGYIEADGNLTTALFVKEILEARYSNVKVTLTRSTDVTVNKTARGKMGAGADLLHSIHSNAGPVSARGTEVFYSVDLLQDKTFAAAMSKAIASAFKVPDRGAMVKESELYPGEDYFTVIDVAQDSGAKHVLLSESLFHSNPQDEAILKDDKNLKRIAEIMVDTYAKFLPLEAKKPVVEPITGTPIMGEAECTAKQLELYLLANNKEPKLNIGVKEFCKLWIEEGNIEGVKGDVAFCQACHETGFFKYGGQVLPEQNNYGGIGATNNSATGKGAWFGYPQMGVRASIQHLKAYASKEPLKQECVDPRYHLVTKGIAPTFEDLGGRWAVPGFDKAKYKTIEEAKAAKASYGDAIIKKFNLLKLMIVPTMPDVSEWALPGYEWAIDNGITDGDRPKDAVTREELWTMMYRAYQLH